MALAGVHQRDRSPLKSAPRISAPRKFALSRFLPRKERPLLFLQELSWGMAGLVKVKVYTAFRHLKSFAIVEFCKDWKSLTKECVKPGIAYMSIFSRV